ncbi:MAG: OmpA family protein [Legionella sp.]|nr:MAG: OmpA family protein [Legionella sp.]
MNKLCKVTLMCSWLGLQTGIAQPVHINFASPMGDEKWTMSGSPLRCGLSLKIPNYGIGYFEQFATKDPHFILRKWEEVLHPVPAQVFALSPVWKPKGQNILVTRSSINPGEFGIYLRREPALKLLGYLSQGFQINFDYRSAEGFNVSVVISPIRFQKVYAKYQQCLGGLMSFDYSAVKESVFHFGVDSKELSDDDKVQLRRIAKYVAADDQIEQVRVLGYADENGRKGYNNAISQFRAQAVQNYLLKLGVSKKKMYVTWFGALKPVGRNDTDEGRAANRRVVVELIKK